MTEQHLKIAVVGAGGKMGLRVSNNLQRSTHDVRYVENSPAGQRRTIDAGRTLTDAGTAVRDVTQLLRRPPLRTRYQGHTPRIGRHRHLKQ